MPASVFLLETFLRHLCQIAAEALSRHALMPIHVLPNVLSLSLTAYAGLSVLKHEVLLLLA